MTDIYSFRPGPKYRAASSQELLESAISQPLSMTSTFFDQAKGGILESFGLGTAIRSFDLPEEAPDQQGIVVQPTDGSPPAIAPDTPQMRRRITAAGPDANTRQETPSELAARRDEAGAMDESQYKSSAFYRDGVPWDRGMTQARAEALAEMYDAKQVRDFYAQKRPFASFLGNLTGQAFDPINYVPIAGPLVKAAAVARFGKIGGAVLHSAIDAAANTALAAGLTADQRAVFGDDVSWQTTISQIATAALIGGAFGAVGGVLGKRADAIRIKEAETRLATLKATQEARIALNEGIDAVVRGEDLRLSPNAIDPMARIAVELQQSGIPALQSQPIAEPPIPEGVTRVYHSGSVGEGETGRWVSTNRQYASNYRPDLPLYYLDVPSTDPRVNNADIPEQGVAQGFTFNFETTPQEAARLSEVMRSERGAVAELPVSEIREPAAAGSSDALNAVGDTKQGLSLRAPDGQPLSPATGNIARPTAIDNTLATPQPKPEGFGAAEARAPKPDSYKDQAEQFRVDPATGAFHEEADIAQLAAEGRLTSEDVDLLTQAQADFEAGDAYAEALMSVARCVL